MTEDAEYRFTIKESRTGVPWIMCELSVEPGLSILENGFLGFRLPPGTSLDQAKEIAKFLNEKIVQLSYTRLYGK
jgi:hypothetical protein